MRRGAVTALLLVGALGGCGLFRRPLPPAPAHYTLGGPYQLGGNWYYPQDRQDYSEAGLAAVLPDRMGIAADGERFDGNALVAAHRTLQLPAVVRVTNLENGRSMLLRLVDRGPEDPGRLLGLTRRAAALLGITDGTQIRVELDSARTQAVTDQVGGGPRLAVATAPRGAVAEQALPPPPGMRGAAGSVTPTAATAAPQASPALAGPLPETVTQGPPTPGTVLLRASEFSRADYANRQAAQLAGLGASVDRVQDGRSTRYAVKAGPFPSVAAADAALDQARRAGVIDSRLVVE